MYVSWQYLLAIASTVFHLVQSWRESRIIISGYQLKVANNFGDLPIIGIKSQSFLKSSILAWFLPIKSIDRLRDKMHYSLSLISNSYTEITASKSSHFVWIDEPELIIQAVQKLL